MNKSIAAFVVAALLAPAGVAAQGTGWWAPMAERLPATGDPGLICTMAPDLPACRGGETARDSERFPRGETRDRDGRDGRDTRDTRDTRAGEWERDGREARGRQGAGPPFCRNGQGHPVHGRQWCRDKGFGDQRASRGAWEDVRWEDVVFGPQPRTRDRLDRGGLADVLGDVVLGRLDARGRQLGSGALNGRFVEGRTRILQVRAGEVPVAELMDANGDGRVDRILVRQPR